MVQITFSCDGSSVSEANPVDFGTVLAGDESEVKTITVTNSGDSDAEQCTITPIEASTSNGFATTTQTGTAAETYNAQTFSSDASITGSTVWYPQAFVGTGASYPDSLGGTIPSNGGTASFSTKWSPPSTATAGNKIWGNEFSCVYV